MKKILFIICMIIFGFALPAMSQNVQTCQPDSAKIYYAISQPWQYYGGVWDFKCSYDADGLLEHLRVDAYYDESCVVRDYKYEYDANHNIVTSNYTGYDCDYPGIQYKTENVFRQNLIRSQTRYTFYSHENGWAFTDSTTYQYDESDRRILADYYNANRIHVSTTRYEYGDNERVITTEKLIDDAWQPVKRETDTYSTTETLLSVMTETYNDGSFSNTTLVTYSYDEQNHRTGVLTQQWEDEQWKNIKYVDNSYDENGHLVDATLKNWQDGAFMDTNRAVYELNEEGYPAVVSFEKWNGEEWVEGTWVSDFYVYSEKHLSRQNKELCDIDVKRIVIHYATTPMPDYDVEEKPAEEGFATIHPNPTIGQVTIMGQDLKTVEVFNTLGQQVSIANGNGERITLDIRNLPAGIYFVNITDSEGRKCVKKVVKE